MQRIAPQIRLLMVLIAISICLGIVCFWTVGFVKQKTVLLRDDTLRKLAFSAELNSYQSEGYVEVLLMVNSDDPQKIATYRAERHVIREKIDATLKEYGARVPPNQPNTKRDFDSFVAERKAYRQIADQVVELLEAGDKTAARGMTDTTLNAAYRKYTLAGDVLLAADLAAGDSRTSQIETACRITQFVTAFVCLCAFLIGVFTPVLFVSTLPEDQP